MNPEFMQRIFALLFASDEPLTAKRIAEILDVESAADIREAIDGLSQKLDEEKYSILIDRIAGGYQLITRSEYVSDIARLYTGRRKQRLTRAGLETLAIIAYKQPITRADIEQLRGVSCGGVLSTLLERSLIRISGKAKVLGAPFLYSTTQEFLEYLGLNGLKDLPSLEQLEELLEQEEYKEESGESLRNGGPDSSAPTDEEIKERADTASKIAPETTLPSTEGETSNEPPPSSDVELDDESK